METTTNHVPYVSVIMPLYNCEKFIRAAVDSVIRQTVTDWELFIIDDCSTDHSLEIARQLAAEDPRITVLENGVNLGVSKSRNCGLDMCRGQYVALLDSDDIWHPEKLERQIAAMQAAGADVSYCSYSIISEEGVRIKNDYIVPARVDFKSMLKENVIGCSTVMLTREIARNYRFVSNFFHEDYVMWLEILQAGHVAAGCTEVLSEWRCFHDSRSANKARAAMNRWRIYRKYLRLSLPRSTVCLGGYLVAGLRKYRRCAA